MDATLSYSILFLTEFNENSSPLYHTLNTLPRDYHGLTSTTIFNFVDQRNKIDSWIKKLDYQKIKYPVAVIEVDFNLEPAFEVAKAILPYCPDKIKHIIFCLDGCNPITIAMINDLSLSSKKRVRRTDHSLCVRETVGLLEDFMDNGY